MAEERDPIYGIQSLLSRLEIQGTLTTALIDSGAAVSVIRLSTLESLERSMGSSMEQPDIQATSVNGVSLCFVGRVRLQCRWFRNSTKFFGSFYVTQDLSVPVVIGIDVLHAQRCAVDFHLGLLDCGEAVLECESPSVQFSKGLAVEAVASVAGDVSVPARSEALIPCTIGCNDPAKLSVVFEFLPCVGLIDHAICGMPESLLVAPALVNIGKDKSFVARVMNLSQRPVKLFRNQSLAKMSQAASPCVAALSSVGDGVHPTLPTVLKDSLSTLDDSQREKAIKILERHSEVFAREKWDLGRCDLHKLQIKLKENAQPSRVPYRSMNPSKRKALKEFVENLQENNLIEPTHSEWAAPTVLVPKKDGSYRLVIDYRKLNAQTVKTSWPLPRISDILASLEGSSFFSSLDLATGFHQMEIEEEDQYLTSFITPFGLFKWKRMPMGLCNAPGAFQRLMEIVLTGLTYDIVLVYIDDIIVYGSTFDEHLLNLSKVLTSIGDANLKISPSKCKLFQRSICFLGHVISKDGVQTDPLKVKAVAEYPVPVNIKQLRAFLGLTGFYRKFIANFGLIAQPLYALLNKQEKFIWNDGCQQSFEKLKAALVKAPVLGFPNEYDSFTLCTDASLSGIGAVLSQKQNNTDKVIAYASKTLQKGQRNYSATKRELFAVVFFTQYFKDYLLGRKFFIITDHRALVWLYSFKEPDGLVARWLEKLSVFDFEICHRPGTKIAHADALSRIPDNIPMVSNVGLDDSQDLFHNAQLKDEIISEVISWVKDEQKPAREELFGKPTLLVNYWHQFDSLCLENGILCRRYETVDGSLDVLQLCVPLAEVPQILKTLHDDPSGGHLGSAKTLYRVKQKFYWPGNRNDVENWVASCVECQSRKNPKQKHRQPMTLWPSSEPFYHVSVDIMGPLPMSKGYKYILMIGDNFSRWFEAIPLMEITAKAVCMSFIESWVSRYGIPEYIHSDNGVQFTSNLFRDMCSALNIVRTRSTPYHPQGNAKVERINRTIEDGLAKYCSEFHETWSDHLQSFLMAYRSAVHESTGHTPYKVLMGRDMRIPIDLMYPTAQPNNIHSYQSLVHKHLQTISTIYQFVRQKCDYEHRRQKVYFDKKVYGPTFSVGDLVLVHSPVLKPGQVSKFKNHWSGPYLITKN